MKPSKLVLRRVTSVAAAAVATALLATGLTVASSAPTVAATPYGFSLKAEPHHTISSKFWTGQFGDGSFCNDYNARQPSSPTGTVAANRLPTMPNQAASLAAATIIDVWGDPGRLMTNGNMQMTAVRFALFQLQGDKKFLADLPGYYRQLGAKTPTIKALVAQMIGIGRAAAENGGLKPFVSATHVLPGGLSTVTVSVKAGVIGVPNIPIRLAVTGGSANRLTGVTGKTGTASFAVRAGVSGVTIKPTLRLPAATIKANNPPKGYQHLYKPMWRNVTISTSFQRTLDLTVGYDCSIVCDGKPPVTYTAKAGASRTQWEGLVDGVRVSGVDLVAGSTSASRSFVAADNKTVTLRYRVLIGTTWSAWRNHSTMVIDCPPVIQVTFQATCLCNGANATFSTPVNTTGHTQKVIVGAQEFEVLPGASLTTQSITLSSGLTISVSAQGTNGTWHSRQLLTIG